VGCRLTERISDAYAIGQLYANTRQSPSTAAWPVTRQFTSRTADLRSMPLVKEKLAVALTG